MDDKRNIIMAVLLTGIILFGWPLLMETFFPGMANKNEAVEQTHAPAADMAGSASPDVSTTTGGADIATSVAAGKAVSVTKALKGGDRIAVETPRVKGSINLTGAKLDDLTLTDHRVALDRKSAPVRLLAPSGTKNAYFNRFGWAGDGVQVPDDDTVWTASADKLTPATPVTLSWSNEGGQTFAITYSIDENYLITVEQSVTNRSENAIALNPYGLLSRVRDEDNIPPGEQSSWTIHIGPMGVFDGTADFDWDYEDVAEAGANGVDFDATKGWLGFTDKYWLGALIPQGSGKIDAKFRAGNNDVYQAQIARENAQVVAPGKVLTTTTRLLFAGAKETALLDTYKEQYGITLLDRAIDWGWFYWFEKPIVLPAQLAVRDGRQFRRCDHPDDLHVVRGSCMFPIAQKAICEHGADARGAAEDEEDPGKI